MSAAFGPFVQKLIDQLFRRGSQLRVTESPTGTATRLPVVRGPMMASGARSSRRSSCALAATMIVDSDIKIAPIDIGSTNPTGASTPAASGTEIRLYPAAHHRFCFIFRYEARESSITDKIGAEMSVDRKAARRSYEEYYKHTSAYAHPSATSVLPLVFGRESGHGFGVRLYPDVDDKTFRAVAREITAVGIFTAFALVRAAAEVEVLPPELATTPRRAGNGLRRFVRDRSA